MTEPLRIVYFLEDTDLAGGIRVAVAHADALIERGHDVTLATKGGPLTWRGSRAKWLYVDEWSEVDLAPFEFVVGTFWKTLFATHALAADRAIHLCQGYEGSFTAYAQLKDQIDEAYRLPMPKITVSPHLVDICRAFYDDATYIGQIVDDVFYQPHAAHAGPPRVLLVGPAQADFKGIDVGYDAVRHARSRGAEFELIRVSQWVPAPGEPTDLAAEFHVALDSQQMARLMASCDIFLGPSRHQEGFGLPAAEALASGLTCVLSEIPSFLSWFSGAPAPSPVRAGEGAGAPLFTPEDDAAAMGDALVKAIENPIASREVVEQFRAARTGERLERYFMERRRARERTYSGGR
jgi:glycosyltransferase involved in cell wall biosynthesis